MQQRENVVFDSIIEAKKSRLDELKKYYLHL